MKFGLTIGCILGALIGISNFDGVGDSIGDWWGNDWIERPSEEYTHLVIIRGRNYENPSMEVFENVKGFDWDMCEDDISLFRSGEDTPFAVIENVKNHRWMLASEVEGDPKLAKFIQKPKEETEAEDK